MQDYVSPSDCTAWYSTCNFLHSFNTKISVYIMLRQLFLYYTHICRLAHSLLFIFLPSCLFQVVLLCTSPSVRRSLHLKKPSRFLWAAKSFSEESVFLLLLTTVPKYSPINFLLWMYSYNHLWGQPWTPGQENKAGQKDFLFIKERRL